MHALFSQDPDWDEKEFKYVAFVFLRFIIYIWESVVVFR